LSSQHIRQFVHRWWLVVLAATLLAGVASYVVSARLPKVYESTAKLLVAPGQLGNVSSNYNDVLAGERLSRTYAEVIENRSVVEDAVQRAGLSLSYEQAVALIDVKPVANTQLIQVTARSDNPETAARLANEVCNAFIDYTRAKQSSRFTATLDDLNKQLDQLSANVADRSAQLAQLRATPNAATDGQISQQVDQLLNGLNQTKQTYDSVSKNLSDVRLAEARDLDLLTLAWPASASATPVQPRVLLNSLIAALVGLMGAIGVAVLIERLDDRLHSSERVARLTGLMPLGTIGILPKESPRLIDAAIEAEPLYREQYLTAHMAEALRLLRANLQFVSVNRPVRTLLVTSVEPAAGKSTIAANLAIVLAQSGKSVILMDGDLRRPCLHRIFGTPNGAGLTRLLLNDELKAGAELVPTRVEGLRLLGSGPLPPNPSELLASTRMQQRLAEVTAEAEFVVIDSPPILPVSDPCILAGIVDGVLLVVDAGRTRGQQTTEALTRLEQAGARVLGAVVNRASLRNSAYYATYDRSPEPELSGVAG
jgi:non-specific protein-tyrosine kinase